MENPGSTEQSTPRVHDVMTRDPAYVGRDDTIQHAAKLMDDLNIGSLPVCVDGRLTGMVTDRDITVRCIAAGLGVDTRVSDAMSEGAQSCNEIDTIDNARQAMADHQIRRMPVVDSDNKLVGIVSLGDISLRRLGNSSLPGRPWQRCRPLLNRIDDGKLKPREPCEKGYHGYSLCADCCWHSTSTASPSAHCGVQSAADIKIGPVLMVTTEPTPPPLIPTMR